jgi:hypothetical protein
MIKADLSSQAAVLSAVLQSSSKMVKKAFAKIYDGA